jgi:hypothetical protein
MEDFEFVADLSKLDERSIFANRVLKLIYQKNEGDINKSMEEADPFFDDFDNLVRNIYELIENEIPLYAYRNLLKYGRDNWGYTEIEFKDKITKTIDACEFYYS